MADNFPCLHISGGPEKARSYVLRSGENRIGRSPENDVILSDNSVSRHHTVVFSGDGGSFLVKDGGSRNGTFLDNERIPQDSHRKLFHLDVIHVGIYELRYLEQPFREEDLKERIAEKKLKSQEGKLQPVGAQKNIEPVVTETDEDSLDLHTQGNIDDSIPELGVTNKPLRWIFIGVAVICVLAGVLLYLLRNQNTQEILDDHVVVVNEESSSPPKDVPASTKVTTPPKTVSPTPELAQVIPLTDKKTESKKQIFLDLKTLPMPADITVNGERLGRSPLKTQVFVSDKDELEIIADFDLREISDQYRKKVTVPVKSKSDVIEVEIRADLATLQVTKLPRRTDFYLEGYYDYDVQHLSPVRITSVGYGKPIYLPFGTYLIELRERSKVSGSQNEIVTARYQRDIKFSNEQREYELKVSDDDLKTFPAVIRSSPSNAKVFLGEEELGTTPYTGNLPVGSQKLRLVKEGYFEKVIDIDMPLNAVYETTIDLETSKMGAVINKAKEAIRRQSSKEAIEFLIEALKFGGSEKEKAEVYYLLGGLYFNDEHYESALPYYEKAVLSEDFRILADLGRVRVYQALKNDTQAMKIMVGVLAELNETIPLNIRNEAQATFKKLSPFKSVIFVATEPAGAMVFLNDKKVAEETPLILGDLGLGNYRIEIQKPGFKTFKTTQNLKIGEFVAIKVALEPEQY